MTEEEYYQWRLFYPLTSYDENIRTEKKYFNYTFYINDQIENISIIDEKHSHQFSYVDIYFALGTADLCLKIHDFEKKTTKNFKTEIEIRNRYKEQQSSII